MASKQFLCIKSCYRRNPAGLWRLYDLGETEWYDEEKDKPSKNHWVETQPGQPANAYDTLRGLCISLGLEPGPKWDLPRMQREYEYALAQKRTEMNRQPLAKNVSQSDGDVTGQSVMPLEKGKKK